MKQPKKSLKKGQGEQKVLKLFKKFSFLIVITVCMFSLNSNAFAAKETGIPVMTEEFAQELTVDNNSNIKDLDIEPINTDKVKRHVVPDTKQEGKKLIGLFIKTMLMVAFCAVVIYFILLFIKKFKKSSFIPYDEEYENEEMLELTTPRTKTEALKSFLNRTK